jgi:hypothetical protein
MKRLFNILLIGYLLLTSLIFLLRMQSCTRIGADQREKLADPIKTQQYQISKRIHQMNSFQQEELKMVQPASEEDAVVRSNCNQDPVNQKP